jgi:hypothetical protein
LPLQKLLFQHTRFLFEQADAKAVVSDMTKKVQVTRYDVVRAQDVTERDAETIRSAFVYEGFSIVVSIGPEQTQGALAIANCFGTPCCHSRTHIWLPGATHLQLFYARIFAFARNASKRAIASPRA